MLAREISIFWRTPDRLLERSVNRRMPNSAKVSSSSALRLAPVGQIPQKLAGDLLSQLRLCKQLLAQGALRNIGGSELVARRIVVTPWGKAVPLAASPKPEDARIQGSTRSMRRRQVFFGGSRSARIGSNTILPDRGSFERVRD
jgi:hypothetical protein